MRRYNVWIEPTLTAEWSRLIRYYAENQERVCDQKVLMEAMLWPEHKREFILQENKPKSLLTPVNYIVFGVGKD